MSYQEEKEVEKYWWKSEKGKVYESLFSILKFFEKNQSWREQMILRALRLYGDFKNLGMTANTYAQNENNYNSSQNRLTLNVIKSVCDTATNKIAKNKPKPTFLTEGGNESSQRKAKLLDKFIQGIFYVSKAYREMQRIFLDSGVFGSGLLKYYRLGKKIHCERVFINELRVDEAEAINGNPRQLFQIKTVNRDQILSMFPDKKDIILEAQDVSIQKNGYKNIADQITVVESWHLKSGEESEDGRHCICISTGDLIDESYEKDKFPFIHQKWSERLLGYWGYGVAEMLTGIQFEINSLLQTIQISMRLCSVPKVFVEVGSKVVPDILNNEIGGIIYYSGTPPQYQAVSAVPIELFQQVERLYQRAYELAGVSSLSAQSKKPEGLDSGVAIREFNNIESERFALIQQHYEDNIIQLAEGFIDLAKEIFEEYGEFEVSILDNKELKTIKWSEIDLDKSAYRMKIYPTSALPSEPGAKLQKVVEYYQAGFLPKEVAFSLLEFPDIEAASKRITADYDDIQMIIESILDDGKYYPPEPYQNLNLGIQEIQRAYLRARINKASPQKLELMRRWISQAQTLMKSEASAMQALQAPPPLANPQASPVSDLVPLPNANIPA